MRNFAGGGFLSNFAQGFGAAEQEKLKYEDQYNAQADANIREHIANVDPMAELYRRESDIKTESEMRLSKYKQDAMHEIFKDAPPNTIPATILPQVDNPTPTVTPPSSPLYNNQGGDMSQPFGPPSGSQISTSSTEPPLNPSTQTPPEPSPFEKAQYLRHKSAQLHAAGLHDEAAGIEQEAVAQEKLDEHNRAENKIEPTPNKSAEGMNVNEQLLKEVDENKKVAGDSIYLPNELQQNTADDKVYKLDKLTAETIHTPLAQAEMAHQRTLTPDKPEEEVYGLVKNNTLAPTKDIVTLNLNDPHITTARKIQAMQDLIGYMKSTYGNDIDGAIKKDKNLQQVFTPKLLNTMTTLMNPATTTTTEPVNND